MNYSVREACEDDFPIIIEMIRELAVFEKAPEAVTNSVEQMKKESDYFRCFLAVTDKGDVIGMALCFFAYFTWVGKSLYLDDIYVRESFRKTGAGTLLLKKIFETARDEGCKRVRWQVLRWNEGAIDMYRKCGALVEDEWLNCTFDSKGIADFPV